MTIDCAFYGFLAADAESKVSKAGKSWTRLRVGIGKDQDIQWVSVAVFGKAAEKAGELCKGDRVYVEGSIKLESWHGQDGAERHGLSVAAFKCDRTHQIGRNKPRHQNDHDERQQRSAATTDNFHSDPIPF
jgi:single-stranded DNA-binding protein